MSEKIRKLQEAYDYLVEAESDAWNDVLRTEREYMAAQAERESIRDDMEAAEAELAGALAAAAEEAGKGEE